MPRREARWAVAERAARVRAVVGRVRDCETARWRVWGAIGAVVVEGRLRMGFEEEGEGEGWRGWRRVIGRCS